MEELRSWYLFMKDLVLTSLYLKGSRLDESYTTIGATIRLAPGIR